MLIEYCVECRVLGAVSVDRAAPPDREAAQLINTTSIARE